MMEGIRAAIPDVQLQCLEMSSLSMQQQVQLVGQASVHVCAHGGLSYLSLFAHEGASLVLLVMQLWHSLAHPDTQLNLHLVYEEFVLSCKHALQQM